MPFLHKRIQSEVLVPDGMLCDRCGVMFNDPGSPEEKEPYGVLTYHTEEGDELSVYCSTCYENIIGLNIEEPTQKLGERNAYL